MTDIHAVLGVTHEMLRAAIQQGVDDGLSPDRLGDYVGQTLVPAAKADPMLLLLEAIKAQAPPVVNVAGPTVNVAPAPAPVVNVTSPDVHVHPEVKAEAAIVNVTTPETPAPVVNVTTPDTMRITSMPPRVTRRQVTSRNRAGSIEETVDIEADAGDEQ